VTRKAQEERNKVKKVVVVSKITPKDKEIFVDALKKLKCERHSRSSDHVEYLSNLKKARGVSEENERTKKVTTRTGDGDFCSMSCPPPKEKRSKSRSKSRTKAKKGKKGAKSDVTSDYSDDDDEEKDPKLISKNKYRPKIKIPPFKTKPWVPPTCPAEARLGGAVKKPRPIVIIPPFKTCKWVPKPQIKPRKKIDIEYPPLTMRTK
jgi:hypothetical protein